MTTIRFQLDWRFDPTVESDPVFRFRHQQHVATWSSSKPGCGSVVLPLGTQPCPVFVDLFANTSSRLSARVELPCRRMVARAVFWWPSSQSDWIDSTDFVPGHVKFRIRLEGEGGGVDEKNQKQHVERLCADVYSLCLRGNRTFGSDAGRYRWVNPAVQRLNVSYIDALVAPLADRMRQPVPGWVDLRHLSKQVLPERSWLDFSFELAALRMGVSRSQAEKDPVLALELLVDAAAWVGRRCVYLHDSVDTTPVDGGDGKRGVRSIVGVEAYTFPQELDRLADAGDDCESLTKQTLCFFEGLRTIRDTGGPWAFLYALSRRYVWFQATGGIECDGSASAPLESSVALPACRGSGGAGKHVVCHSWGIGVFADTDQGKLPSVVTIESTDYKCSTSFEYKDEQQRADWYLSFLLTCPSAMAFRCKAPHRACTRYPYMFLVSLLSCEDLSERKTFPWPLISGGGKHVYECVVGTRDSPTADVVLGLDLRAVDAKQQETFWSTSRIVLVPNPVAEPLTSRDLATADAILEWYPPLLPMERGVLPPSPPLRAWIWLQARQQDWEVHGDALIAWMKDHHPKQTWTVTKGLQDWKGAPSVVISIHL
jgi:hypothetical protein